MPQASPAPPPGSLGATANPKFPPSMWTNVFAQLVGPLITEITCLRSHELKVFHLVSAHVGSPLGATANPAAWAEAAHR